MAFADTQNLSPDTPTDVDTNTVAFVKRFGDEQRGVLSVQGLTAPAEKMIEILQPGPDKNGVRRHTVRYTQTGVDALGVAGYSSWDFTCRRAPNTFFTDAVLIAMFYQMVDMMIEGGAGANLSRLLNGETL
jgi:hypothetical protein